MWHYHRSWKAGAEALITGGAVFLFIFILALPELLSGKDYITLCILFFVGVACITSGILIKRWARKNGKK